MALGIDLSTRFPVTKVVAVYLSTIYIQENLALSAVNSYYYKPLIVKHAPYYAMRHGLMTIMEKYNFTRNRTGGGFGGGGAAVGF